MVLGIDDAEFVYIMKNQKSKKYQWGGKGDENISRSRGLGGQSGVGRGSRKNIYPADTSELEDDESDEPFAPKISNSSNDTREGQQKKIGNSLLSTTSNSSNFQTALSTTSNRKAPIGSYGATAYSALGTAGSGNSRGSVGSGGSGIGIGPSGSMSSIGGSEGNTSRRTSFTGGNDTGRNKSAENMDDLTTKEAIVLIFHTRVNNKILADNINKS